jgi:GntR family transcriptional regulator
MLNKTSPIPLYQQLKMAIEELMDSGHWPPDSQVPSERELCEQFEISRITVRQALSQLVSEGRLVRSHGRGTFVCNAPLKKQLLPLIGFSEEMRSRGKQPGGKVLHFESIAAPAAIARALDLREGDTIIMVQRLRLADHVPMAVETVHLPAALCPGLGQEDLENRSLYETLKRKYQFVPTRASQQWQAVSCPESDAKLLDIPPHSPILRIQRTTYQQEDVPFEYLDSFFRGDKYVFHAELRTE